MGFGIGGWVHAVGLGKLEIGVREGRLLWMGVQGELGLGGGVQCEGLGRRVLWRNKDSESGGYAYS